MDKQVENLLKLLDELGADFDMNEEYVDELSNEDIIYDWDEVM